MHRTNYFHISQINSEFPDPIKGVAWFGYGAPDSSYIVPLSGTMDSLPDFYRTGSRWEAFDRDSGWWINIYVQQMTELRYNEAIEDLYAFRDPKLKMLYQIVPEVQKKATKIYQNDSEKSIELLQNFYYQQTLAFHESWKNLGDILLGKYAMGLS
ncbi:MAG: C69 family dipeptidase [Atribacterota bacterium]